MEDINITQPPPDPWLQQEDEGSEAYAAFCIYRDLGPNRSIDQAYRQHMSNKRAQENSISKNTQASDAVSEPVTDELSDAIAPPESAAASPPAPEAVAEEKLRSSGRWNAWNTRHDWARRALTYDQRLATVEHETRELAIAENAVDWAEERHRDTLERLDTYRHLRTALNRLTRKATVETKTKVVHKNEDGDSISSEVRLLDQFKILNDLRKSLFPPDAMDLSEWSTQWSKFAPPETIITITSTAAREPASLDATVGSPIAPDESIQSSNA